MNDLIRRPASISRAATWRPLLLCCCLATLASSAVASDLLQPIFLSYLPPDGTAGAGVFIANGAATSLNNLGQVFFEGEIRGPAGGPMGPGLWRYEQGTATALIEPGTTVPVNGNEVAFQGFYGFSALNETNPILLRGNAQAPAVGAQEGLWVVEGDEIRPIIVQGQEMPGIRGGFADAQLRGYRYNSGGRAVVHAELGRLTGTTAEDRQGIWYFNGASTELLAEQFSALPGLQAGETVRLFAEESLALNEQGDALFMANYANLVGTDIDGYGVWLSPHGGPLELAVNSDEMMEVGGQLERLSLSGHRPAQLNNAGQILFQGVLDAPGQVFGTSEGMWLQEPNGQRRLVVRTNSGPHSATLGVEFASFDTISSGQYAALNDQGKIAFLAAYREATGGSATVEAGEIVELEGWSTTDDVGPNIPPVKQGLWSDEAGELSLVAKVGDLAPGDGRAFKTVRPLAVNKAGQIMFSAELLAPGDPLTWGLWAQDRSGSLQLIVKTGQEIDVAPGAETDLRTVSSIAGPIGSWLNDQGQILFMADFTDGTRGAFLSNAVAIPEPAAAALALLGVAGWARFAGAGRTRFGRRDRRRNGVREWDTI